MDYYGRGGGRRSYQGGQWSTLAVRMGLQLFKNKGMKEKVRSYSIGKKEIFSSCRIYKESRKIISIISLSCA